MLYIRFYFQVCGPGFSSADLKKTELPFTYTLCILYQLLDIYNIIKIVMTKSVPETFRTLQNLSEHTKTFLILPEPIRNLQKTPEYC